MENITKVYPNGFIANKDVSLSVRKGEIHGLVGENGAGKSTLMKILFGQEQPEAGRILYKGEEVKITNPFEALKLGIGMVHQHFMLVPSLTVAENMVLGIEPKRHGFFEYKKAVEMTQATATKFGLPIDPNAKVRDLYVGHKQRVEILKMLLRDIDVLILDEPTAVLTPQETRELFVQLKHLRTQGYTIVFISHKLNEIKEICDRITVLRDGHSIQTVNTADVSERDISQLMVGRNAVKTLHKEKMTPHEVVLQVRNINYFNKYGKKILDDVSFDIREGEILGIAGIEGNGQKELSELITQLDSIQSGAILVDGMSIDKLSVRKVREAHVSHIPEDRMTYGAVGDLSIAENIISDRFYKPVFSEYGLLKKKHIDKTVENLILSFKIKGDGGGAAVKTLSGGNIQKVVAAREFSSRPRLLIANQPTRGIDVGASELIRSKIVELRDEGAAILLISADIGELLEVSDSLLVLCEGQIRAFFDDVVSVTEQDLGEYMLGIKTQDEGKIRMCIHD